MDVVVDVGREEEELVPVDGFEVEVEALKDDAEDIDCSEDRLEDADDEL